MRLRTACARASHHGWDARNRLTAIAHPEVAFGRPLEGALWQIPLRIARIRDVSNANRKTLHELVDALPPGEEQAAQRYLEYLRDASDPFAHLDRVDPFADMSVSDREKLHASLERAEEEIAAGRSIPAEDVVRKARTRR